jgi:hypothetical protein
MGRLTQGHSTFAAVQASQLQQWKSAAVAAASKSELSFVAPKHALTMPRPVEPWTAEKFQIAGVLPNPA